MSGLATKLYEPYLDWQNYYLILFNQNFGWLKNYQLIKTNFRCRWEIYELFNKTNLRCW